MGGRTILVLAFVYGLVQSLGKKFSADAASNQFITALRDGDYARAYAMGTPRLRYQYSSQAQFTSAVQAARLSKWDWGNPSSDDHIVEIKSSGYLLSGGGGADTDMVVTEIADTGSWQVDSWKVIPWAP